MPNADKSFRSPPHDETGHSWHHDDGTLLDSIRRGGTRYEGVDMGATSPMPAFETVLSETEMLAVLEYIKSSWPKEIRDMQWQRSQQIIEFEQSQQELEKDN